ncbi:MAG: phage major capsid protein, partial [Selenomonadaceae bacterium]|nr:phage major capsid protein [Selenomonadaceae bacterium]
DKELRGNTKSGRATEEYRQAALTAIRTKFRKIDNALATNPDQSGGYLIPDEWDSRLIQTLEEENVMRRLGTRITTSGEHKINIAATKPAALWVAEGGQMTFGTGTFAQISLDAHKVHVGILVTEELLADNAFNLESYIVDQFGKAIANAEEDAFINGDGNGKPTGFLTTVAADTDMFFTTSGTAPTADEIVDLIYKLPRPYRKSASFLVNDSTLKLLRKFKDSNQRYLWEESYQAGEPSSFMGYKIYTSPYMPLAESGNFAIAFGDFSYYNIADRGSRSFQELRELYAGNGMVGFLLKERCDGVLIDKSAIRALKIK